MSMRQKTRLLPLNQKILCEIKKLANPSDIIKLVFDGVLLLFQKPMLPVKQEQLYMNKQDIQYIMTSFKPCATSLLTDSGFLGQVLEFGRVGKDKISEETIELLCPYVELENFNGPVAKNASSAAEGLCRWVIAMKYYHEASKVVKPKLEALAIAEASMKGSRRKHWQRLKTD